MSNANVETRLERRVASPIAYVMIDFLGAALAGVDAKSHDFSQFAPNFIANLMLDSYPEKTL
jgi:hypothetical protein